MLRKNLKCLLMGISFLAFSFGAQSMLNDNARILPVFDPDPYMQLGNIKAAQQINTTRRIQVAQPLFTDSPANILIPGAKIGGGGPTTVAKESFMLLIRNNVASSLINGLLGNVMAPIVDADQVVNAVDTQSLNAAVGNICTTPGSLTDAQGALLPAARNNPTIDDAYQAFVDRMQSPAIGFGNDQVNGPIVDLSAGILDGVAAGQNTVDALVDHILDANTDLNQYDQITGFDIIANNLSAAIWAQQNVTIGNNNIPVTDDIVDGFESNYNLRWMLIRFLIEEVDNVGNGIDFRTVRALAKLLNDF